MSKRIRKFTYTVFHFEEDEDTVKEAMEDAFGSCDADLYGGTWTVTDPTPEEEAEARKALEEMDCGLGDDTLPCRRCGRPLDERGFCTWDECFYYDHKQSDPGPLDDDIL